MARRIILLSLFLALGAGGAGYWWLHRNLESTDNAYVRADILPVMSRIQGQVVAIAVQDHQQVRAGDLLLVLDDGDQKLALAQAKAKLAGAEAELAHLASRRQAKQAQLKVAEAALAAADAERQRSGQQLSRLTNLAGKQYVAKDDLDAAELAYSAAQARYHQAQANLGAQQAELAVLDDEAPRLQAAVAQARAGLEQAQLNLGYTRIHASRDGTLASRQVQLGQAVAPGQRLMSLVAEQLWVDANFKETQVAAMAPGQTVEIRADALPGHSFAAKVTDLAGATGSEFALLPPQNATGNFTKVVQRLPVRLAFEDGQDLSVLKPGMSVIATIHTGAQ
ncbi:HlyD family secretion protein [Gallaecimonas sp. GXIMD4217]|uniref:HlyD family secretion protein n=1 Tax=Gallaecimonas sp. GXIMD4217 TaxID=3131927 RepID=UPI00311AEA3C